MSHGRYSRPHRTACRHHRPDPGQPQGSRRPPARGDAASTTGYAAYDALLAEISDLRRSGASDVQTDFSHDLLSVNDYYQTPGWLLRDLDGDGTPLGLNELSHDLS